MTARILSALFPHRELSPGISRVCAAALLLFPLAQAVGFFLLVKNAPKPPVPVTVNRSKAVEIARAFLQSEGVKAEGWSTSANFTTDSNLVDFANAKPERMRLWTVAPPILASVVFRAADNEKPLNVYISVDGKVVGYDWQKASRRAASELTDEQATALAASRLPKGVVFGAPSVEKKTGPEGPSRIYTFHSSTIPDLDVQATATVQGNNLTAFRVKATRSEDAEDSDNLIQTGLTLLGSFFIAIVILYSLYRYASRAMQQEVSHQRSLLVALLCGCFCVLLGLNAVVNSQTGKAPLGLILLVFAVLGLMGGALIAAAYGSGEGDVREAYPGKLTSLDTLLSGHLFSGNVGTATLVGMALASWLILLLGLLGIPFRVGAPQGSQNMVSPMMRFGYLMPFVLHPLLALSFAAGGLLQPMAFLHRNGGRNKRWYLPVLLVCAALVSTVRVHARTTPEFLLTSAILVCALVIPFLLLDLLASLVCVMVVFSAMGMAASLMAVPAFSGPSLVVHSVVALGLMLFAVLCTRWGRTYTEAQVRPLYARHIAERKSLEAEVSAAREAQLRLLPERAPEVAGLHISAACIPAETVGGDFYDFFSLGDGRLGIFLAEGNNRGLAAALTIALAKGYLMQCLERFRDPVEIVARLEMALASIFEGGAAGDNSPELTEFAFASLDTNTGEVCYARTGVYPRVLVTGRNANPVVERLVPVKGRSMPIAEGRASLAPGDHLVLFTDGIGRRMAASHQTCEEFLAAMTSRELKGRGNPAEEIRTRCFEEAPASMEPDDLTMVTIHANADMGMTRDKSLSEVA